MEKRFYGLYYFLVNILLISVIACPVLLADVLNSDDNANNFVYDDGGRPDPFLPLLDDRGNRPKLEPILKQEEFEQQIKKIVVNGILWDEAAPLVMINSKIKKQGDLVFNLKISKIKEDSVIIEYKDLTHEISLKRKSNN